MAGGLLGLKQHMETQSMNSLSKVASEQEANKRLEDQMDQAKSAQKMNSAMMGAGAGWMIGAKIGSVGGPMGMAIGAVGGFLLGDLF